MFLVRALRFLVFSFLLKRSNGTRSNITKFLRLYFAHEPAYNLVPLSRYVHGESILDEDQWHAYILWVFPHHFLPSRLHGRSLKPSLLLQYRLTGWLFLRQSGALKPSQGFFDVRYPAWVPHSRTLSTSLTTHKHFKHAVWCGMRVGL